MCPFVSDKVSLPVDISGTSLQNVHTYEYLGVLVDEKLSMNTHIDHVTKKVQAKV